MGRVQDQPPQVSELCRETGLTFAYLRRLILNAAHNDQEKGE